MRQISGIVFGLAFGLTAAVVVAAPFQSTAAAQDGWLFGAAPSFYYQGPDGSYESPSDFSRALWGVPCGIECTRQAEIRWGLVPPPYPYPPHHWPHHRRHAYYRD